MTITINVLNTENPYCDLNPYMEMFWSFVWCCCIFFSHPIHRLKSDTNKFGLIRAHRWLFDHSLCGQMFGAFLSIIFNLTIFIYSTRNFLDSFGVCLWLCGRSRPVLWTVRTRFIIAHTSTQHTTHYLYWRWYRFFSSLEARRVCSTTSSIWNSSTHRQSLYMFSNSRMGAKIGAHSTPSLLNSLALITRSFTMENMKRKLADWLADNT